MDEKSLALSLWSLDFKHKMEKFGKKNIVIIDCTYLNKEQKLTVLTWKVI